MRYDCEIWGEMNMKRLEKVQIQDVKPSKPRPPTLQQMW